MLSESIRQDVRYGLRLLRRNPGSTLLAVAALATGIGINTAVYTGYKAMVARPLDAHDPSTMVNLALRRSTGGARWSFSYPDYETLRASLGSLSGLIAYRPTQFTFAEDSALRTAKRATPSASTVLGRLALQQNSTVGAAEVASVFVVSANYFRVLGRPLLRGRDFASVPAQEMRRTPLALISENYWQRRFHGDDSIIGRTIFLNGVPVVISGITPHDFCGTSLGAPAFWVPTEIEPLLHGDDQFLLDREESRYRLFGRLRPNATVTQARAEFDAALESLRALHDSHTDAAKPATAIVWEGSPFPLPLSEFRGLRLSVALIMAAAGLVLLVACANVASLQVARMRAREDELRVRRSLGANRSRIVRQLVTETATMGLLAGAVAFLLTWILLKSAALAAANIVPGEYGGLVLDPAPDVSIFVYVFTVSMIAGILSGLAPALESSQAALKATSGGVTASAGARRLQRLLIIAQVALSLVLTVAAAMAIRSSKRAVSLNPGYDTRNVLALSVQFPENLKYTPLRKRELLDELRGRLSALPQVDSVSSGRIPSDIAPRTTVSTVEPEGAAHASRQAFLHYSMVEPNHFETLGIPLLLGPGFGADTGHRLVILSESAAHELWGTQNPVGRRVRLGPTDERVHRPDEAAEDALYEVAGVVRDTRTTDFSNTVTQRLYLRMPEDRAPLYPLLIRVRTHQTAETVRQIDALLTSVDPNLLADCATLERLLSQTASAVVAMMAAVVSATVGLLGLGLAVMGIYGTLSYIVVLRTKEVGIRMAVGAQAGHIMTAILSESAQPLLLGLGVGTLVAAVLAHLARGLLFGLDGVDLESQFWVALLFLAIGLFASLLPTLRATRIDPLTALRDQ